MDLACASILACANPICTVPCGVFRSIGVLAYVMLTGISPFLGENKQETFLNISQLNVSYNEEELQQLDQAALSFIQMLLRKHPQSVHTSFNCLQDT